MTFIPTLAVGIWVSLTARPAVSQELSDPCTEAVRLVSSGEATDTRHGSAIAHIVRCPEGPAAIAARWRASMGRREDLQQLLTWNLQLMDQRIAEAAIATARDAGRPTQVRLAALQGLVSYFDPSATVGVGVGALNKPRSGGMLGALMDYAPQRGAQPPAADLPDRVCALNRELASDRDPAVARAARYVWQVLTDGRPSAASLPVGTATLENICGAKFRITNHSEIDLSVELATTPEKPVRQLRLPAHATRDIGARDTGTVRLVLTGGKELASAHTGPDCR